MNHSASSASSLDSHAPSESSSQSQGMRWEEQQKLLALEQLCGVFRVDLGHMRSLRLFFRSVGECKRSQKGRKGSLCCATVQCFTLSHRLFVCCVRFFITTVVNDFIVHHCVVAVTRPALVASW